MMEFIVPFIVGVVLIALGISNMRGNIFQSPILCLMHRKF